VPLAVAYLGRKRWGDPNFLYAALDAAAYAVPAGRDRMKCAEATKLRRKSGRSPHDRICWPLDGKGIQSDLSAPAMTQTPSALSFDWSSHARIGLGTYFLD
jgi:hypothetical protein